MSFIVTQHISLMLPTRKFLLSANPHPPPIGVNSEGRQAFCAASGIAICWLRHLNPCVLPPRLMSNANNL
jgi:hypothetical protein